MKKSLLVLAVLGAYAGVASAQSSVTVFGIVDLSVNQFKNGSRKSTTMDSNQLNSNRLGFRGTEDLGGGLSAQFWIESAINSDNGTAGAGGTGFDAQRKSTLALVGKFGEVRFGRDYTPVFNLLASNDAYGANGFGNGSNLYATKPIATLNGAATLVTPNNVNTLVRASNSATYFLPPGLGGLYGSVMVAAGEGAYGNKYQGGRLGWSGGPADISIAYSETQINPALTGGDDKFKSSAIGGSYDFKIVKAFAFYGEYKTGGGKAKFYEVSASVPLGAAELRASYGETKFSDTDTNHEKLFGLEAIYNLSKRTALYAQYGELKSSAGSSGAWVLGGAATAQPIAADVASGYKSSAFGAGIRHIF